MDARHTQVPGWVVPSAVQVRDLSCLALRLIAEQRSREAAGMVAAVGWVRGRLHGPATGRAEDALLRQVVVCEFCAAEHLLADGRPVPSLHEVCQLLEVAYRPPLEVDPGYGRGVWLTLRWLLGETSGPPLYLPIRFPDGSLKSMPDIYDQLIEAGVDDVAARETAVELAAESRRLARLVEDTAARVRG